MEDKKEFSVSGVISGDIMPYYRMTQRSAFIDAKAKEYLEQKDTIGMIVANQIKKQTKLNFKNGKMIDFPIRSGVIILLPETKKGEFPKTKGDFDNYVKMFMDTIVSFGIIEDDSSFYYRGSCLVEYNGEMILPSIMKHKQQQKQLIWRITNA